MRQIQWYGEKQGWGDKGEIGKKEKPKHRVPAMNDLNWDEEIPPEDLEGCVEDNKRKIPPSSHKAVYDYLDKIQASHDTENYKKATFF